uniref:Uncharacterized protein n=1 Tax=Dulem virus 106 TaxID=3145583 RepID=A0AAU8B7R0_9VIRU
MLDKLIKFLLVIVLLELVVFLFMATIYISYKPF